MKDFKQIFRQAVEQKQTEVYVPLVMYHQHIDAIYSAIAQVMAESNNSINVRYLGQGRFSIEFDDEE